jgi:hypothetical protein
MLGRNHIGGAVPIRGGGAGRGPSSHGRRAVPDRGDGSGRRAVREPAREVRAVPGDRRHAGAGEHRVGDRLASGRGGQPGDRPRRAGRVPGVRVGEAGEYWCVVLCPEPFSYADGVGAAAQEAVHRELRLAEAQ